MAGSRHQTAFDGHGAPDAPRCAWPGCAEEGLYRAPLARDRLREYRLYCLQHIRDFNRSWNYFEGWNRDEIEAYQHADLFWHRPTWRPDESAAWTRAWRDAIFRERIDDRFGFTREDGAEPRQGARNGHKADSGALAEERRAYAILELEPGTDPLLVKRRFKEHVKLCHPDAHGGDKAAEERLRLVIWAYRRLTRGEAA